MTAQPPASQPTPATAAAPVALGAFLKELELAHLYSTLEPHGLDDMLALNALAATCFLRFYSLAG